MMSGKKGLLADEVNHFVAYCAKPFHFPVVTWDERLTSVQAERSFREGNFPGKSELKNRML